MLPKLCGCLQGLSEKVLGSTQGLNSRAKIHGYSMYSSIPWIKWPSLHGHGGARTRGLFTVCALGKLTIGTGLVSPQGSHQYSLAIACQGK